MLEEILPLQRHLKAIRISPEGTKTITVFQFLEFIVKCDFFFNGSLTNVYLRLFLTIHISVSLREKNSKLNI